MKKHISLAVIFVFLLMCLCVFSACDSDYDYDVVCSIFPQYDFCKEIAGNEVKIKMLLPEGTDAHNYELTTKDSFAVKNSKLFIYIGGESEKWANDLINSSDMSKVKLLKLSDKVEKIFNEDNESHDGHDHHEYFDEHIWLSINNAITICRNIEAALSEIFPEKKSIFEENLRVYISKLAELDIHYKNMIDESTYKKIFFADRFPFIYLAMEYGLSYDSLLNGCSTDTAISVSDKLEFEKRYKDDGAKGVFVLENSDRKLANSVIERCGGKIFTLHSLQILSKEEISKGASYLTIMQKNLSVLQEALK